MITSKSLYHSNIVFVFDEKKFIAPDNDLFGSLYRGSDAEGARFLDDPVMKTKVFTLPRFQIRFLLEGRKFRVEDLSKEEGPRPLLIDEALKAYAHLFSYPVLEGYGFNYDLYYRFNKVVDIARLFAYFFGEKYLEQHDLLDFGIQFTVQNPKDKVRQIWFIKVTAPVEIAVHVNVHFSGGKLPSTGDLQGLFARWYNEIDELVKGFDPQ